MNGQLANAPVAAKKDRIIRNKANLSEKELRTITLILRNLRRRLRLVPPGPPPLPKPLSIRSSHLCFRAGCLFSMPLPPIEKKRRIEDISVTVGVWDKDLPVPGWDEDDNEETDIVLGQSAEAKEGHARPPRSLQSGVLEHPLGFALSLELAV